jgi:hypothetical protein
MTNWSCVSNFLVRSCGAITRGQPGRGRVAYRACLCGAAAGLQCVIWVDRVPGQSTWASPTMNTHPWTPGGSKGARGLLSVPYRSLVVSTVPVCPPDGSPDDQLILDVEWTICVQRSSTCRTRTAQCDTGGRGRASRRRRLRMMLRTPSARRTLPRAPHLPEPRPVFHFRRARPQGKRPPPVVGVTQSADDGFFSFSIKPPTSNPTYVDVY